MVNEDRRYLKIGNSKDPTQNMWYSSYFAHVRKIRGLAVLAIVLIVSTSSFASTPAPPDDIKKLIKQAAESTRAGLLPEAEATLRKAIALDEKRIDTKIELAFVLTKERRLLEAYNLCYPIAQANPKNTRALSVLGTTLLSAGSFRDARLLFYTAVQLNRKEDLAWAGFGMLDFYENKIDASLNNLREAVYYVPDEPDYLFALAQVSARSERYKEAAEAYEQFLNVSKATDEDRRARIKGLIMFLRYLGQYGGLYTSNGRDQTSVPFDLIGNRPVVTLKINGNEAPLRFVLDTGSGISVISEETAQRFKIKPVARGGFARGIGGNGKFEIVYGQLKQLEIGDVKLKNVPVYIRKFHDDGQQIDGYIGLALISKFLTTIDYGNQTLSLVKKVIDPQTTVAAKITDQQEPVASNDLSLPLRLTSSGFLSGEVELQGLDSKLNFIVDTGASVSVISRGVSKTDGISPFLGEDKLRVIGSAGITEDVPTFLLPKITFGKHSCESITAIALDLDLINEASGFEQAGILGGNFLKNYRLTFDFQNSKVIFVSVKPEKE